MKNQSGENIINTIADEKTSLINQSEKTIIDIMEDEETPLINESDKIIIDIVTDEETVNTEYYEERANWKSKSLFEKIIFVMLAIPVYCFIDIIPYILKFAFIDLPILIFNIIYKIFNFMFITIIKFYYKLCLICTIIFIKIPKWFYNNIIVPCYQKICLICGIIFVKVPKWVYNNIIVPCYRKICSICRMIFIQVPKWFYNNIIVPCYCKLCLICRKIFIEFPKWFYNNVIVKSINYIHNGILQAIKYIIKPVCKFIYEYFLYPVYKFIKNTLIITWTGIKYIASYIKVGSIYIKNIISQSLHTIRINIIILIRNIKTILSQTLNSAKITINSIMTNIKIILSQTINTFRTNIKFAITSIRTNIKESLRSLR